MQHAINWAIIAAMAAVFVFWLLVRVWYALDRLDKAQRQMRRMREKHVPTFRECW